MTGRLGERADTDRPAIPGTRVLLDARSLQEPERAPTTATYLRELLGAFAADPLAGESFAFFLQAGRDDPTSAPPFDRLSVVGRRLLPPSRLLRSGALTVDPFLLRGATLGAAWRAEDDGAIGSLYHTASGTAPLASGVPVVVTLLDLAPWELPHAYQASVAARFGHRLRTRILRDAAAIIVTSPGVARTVRRLLRIPRERIHAIPLAAGDAFVPGAAARSAAEARRLGLTDRYLVYPGRYDARQDLSTLLRALAMLIDPEASGAPTGWSPAPGTDTPWPPRLVLVDASPDDRAALARAAARVGVGDLLSYAPYLPDDRLAALIAGARAVVLPTLSDAAGLAAIEAIACGVPVIASAVGPLPEIVAGSGIVVDPRDAARLAVAIATAWTDDTMHARLVETTSSRASAKRRTWAHVARETRQVYASVARPSIG
jgi:glycosyltransferase involved in cell wall biosynthesis